jgi:oligopeptide transport system substrate-binding protein
MRRTAGAAMAFLLSVTAFLPVLGLPQRAAAAGDAPVALIVGKPYAEAGGKKVRLEQRPYIKNGSTLVPVRFISEQLGAEVNWESKTRTVHIAQGKKWMSIAVGSSEMNINGQPKALESAAELVDGTTFVPLRAIVEALGQEVFYDEGLILIGEKSVIAPYSKSPSKRYEVSKRLLSGVLRVAMTSDPPGLDSSKAVATASFSVLGAINEGLYRNGSDGRLAPGLAREMPQVSEDGLTYTILLRDGLQWSDGSPLTAHDFVYTYRRVLDPETGFQYSFMLMGIEGAEALRNSHSGHQALLKEKLGVRAINDTTLEIRLKEPSAIFSELLSFPTFFPVQEKAVLTNGLGYGVEAGTVVGAGPFVLKSWEHNYQMVLEKNDRYWDADNVYLDEVELNMIADGQTTLQLLLTGQLDMASFMRTDLFPGFQTIQRQELTNAFINLQLNKVPAFSNANIRKALAVSIDRKKLLDTVLESNSVLSEGFLPNGLLDGNGNEFRTTAGNTQPSFDPEEARRLLGQGLKELGMKELPSFKLTAGDTDTSNKTMAFIIEQWKEHLGITVEGNPVENVLRADMQFNKDFEALLSLWGADYNDPMTFLDMFESEAEFNNTSYSNSEYDRLIQAARQEKDRAVRTGLLVQAEKQLMTDMPVIPLYYRTHTLQISNRVEGLYLPVFGPAWELKSVRLKN